MPPRTAMPVLLKSRNWQRYIWYNWCILVAQNPSKTVQSPRRPLPQLSCLQVGLCEHQIRHSIAIEHSILCDALKLYTRISPPSLTRVFASFAGSSLQSGESQSSTVRLLTFCADNGFNSMLSKLAVKPGEGDKPGASQRVEEHSRPGWSHPPEPRHSSCLSSDIVTFLNSSNKCNSLEQGFWSNTIYAAHLTEEVRKIFSHPIQVLLHLENKYERFKSRHVLSKFWISPHQAVSPCSSHRHVPHHSPWWGCWWWRNALQWYG